MVRTKGKKENGAKGEKESGAKVVTTNMIAMRVRIKMTTLTKRTKRMARAIVTGRSHTTLSRATATKIEKARRYSQDRRRD